MNSKKLRLYGTNSVHYFIVVKNCLTIWRGNSFRMSIAGVDTGKVLPDPVCTIAMETRSEVEGMSTTPVFERGSSV